jgi:hypothetical protein
MARTAFDPARSSAAAAPLALLAAGLFVGALLGAALRPAVPASGDPREQALEDEVARLNATVSNLSAALREARAQARLAEVAANQAGVTEVTSRHAEVGRLLEDGRRSEAFAPLRGLTAAAGNTSWAPLLRVEAAAVHRAGDALYDRLSFGSMEEANASAAVLRHAVATLEATFEDLYLPYHRVPPAGQLIEAAANLSGFFVVGPDGTPSRNPTLPLAPGATMLIEVTNTDTVNHSLAIPDLWLLTRTAGPGETVGLVVGPAAAGDYRYFCEVAGHEQAMGGLIAVAT